PVTTHMPSFIFTPPSPPAIYTLSLHDALPISRRGFAIGITERPGKTAAGRRDSREALRGDNARAHRVPGIREQQEARAAMERAECLGLGCLLGLVHDRPRRIE